ncbi:hypothetical protein EX895_006125 [Sporisorium graminicola]|uniref:SCP2 domain-containing protein n=1 Tax=Sporisorium graminicola TaxID=280036 RepID=A0A4U7KLA6_9BASI|nr:hypothetical protein EX895_006125 [Sporisorium graminicola]TKY85045.1 hypothetical protein EX895_006125 [Sporisorium graminicola]
MSKAEDQMKAEAIQALETQEDLNCPGFESSRVFALTAKLLDNPPPGFPSRKRLVRSLQSIYLFVIQPSAAIDPSNPRTKPVIGKTSTSGGALRPAMWFADLKNTGRIGRGQPPKTVLGRKRKADIVIECRDRDFLDLAVGKVQAHKLYNEGRIKIKGDLDRALKFASLISHERSKIYGTPTPAADTEAKVAVAEHEREGHSGRDSDYGSGAPAPLPDRARL